jgi:L-fuculose-phosphate aldolase
MKGAAVLGRLRIKYRKQIRELAAASARLADLGFATSRGGNLSARAGEDSVLITPTGFPKRDVHTNDILVMGLDGRIEDARKGVEPSSETPTHLQIMRNRPDVRGIIHAHPPVLTGFALAGIDVLSRPIHPELIVEVGPVIALDYTEPTSEALALQFDSVLGRGNAFLMKGHGVMICSPVGIGRALELLEMLETMAFSAWVAMSIGKVGEIPGAEIDKLEKIMRTRNLPMPGAPDSQLSLRQLYRKR